MLVLFLRMLHTATNGPHSTLYAFCRMFILFSPAARPITVFSEKERREKRKRRSLQTPIGMQWDKKKVGDITRYMAVLRDARKRLQQMLRRKQSLAVAAGDLWC